MKKILLIFFVILYTEKLSSQSFRGAFDKLDIQTTQYYSLISNASREMANLEPYIMRSYINMYKATKDKHYLDKFIIHAKRVQDRRDDNIHALFANGQVLPVVVSQCNINFSQIDPNSKGWAYIEDCTYNVRSILHTGEICLPMAQFVYLVLVEEPQLSSTALPAEALPVGNTYGNFANWLRARLKETISYFDPKWSTFNGFEGYLGETSDPNQDPRDLINMQCSMGGFLAVMYALERDVHGPSAGIYLSKVRTIAHILKTDVLNNQNSAPYTPGFYAWCYHYDCFLAEWEDITHAWLEPLFASLCYTHNIDNGLLFNLNDMQKFANTISQRLAPIPLQTTKNIFGTNTDCPQICDATDPNLPVPPSAVFERIGLYGFLADRRFGPLNPYVYQIISDYYSHPALYSASPPNPIFLLGLSYAALHENIFNPVAVLRGSPHKQWGALCAGDFNGDGQAEFAAANNFQFGSLYSFKLNSDNSISDYLPAQVFPGTWLCFAAANLDGIPGDEIAAINNTGTIYLFKQNGSAFQFLAGNNSLAGNDPTSITVGDVDPVNPGPEIIVSARGNGRLFLFSYSGTNIVPVNNYFVSAQLQGAAAGNFDASSPGDEIAAFNNADGQVRIYKIENNTLTFISSTNYPSRNFNIWSGNTLCAGDFDGDGIAEAAARNARDGFVYLYKIKNGALTNVAEESFSLNQQVAVIAPGRFNNDPSKDALITLRNFDGQINIFNTEGLCPGLNLNNFTIDNAFTIDNPFLPSVDNNYPVDYHVNGTLTAGNNLTISAPSRVDFSAGDEIILKDGFIASTGSDFHAFIDPSLSCSRTAFRVAANNHIKNTDGIMQSDYPLKQKAPSYNNWTFSVEPNPNAGLFMVNTGVESPCTLILFDMMGKTLFRKDNFISRLEVDVSDLPKGIYFVRVLNGESMSKVEKIVVQ